MTCSWDSRNEAKHYQKHKIHFSTAAYVFEHDANPYIEIDASHSDNLQRYIAIARYNDRYLWISYTEPEEDVIRIISARVATKNEIRLYYERL